MYRIASLPAIASHNWCLTAAQSLSSASDTLWNAVAIVTPDPANGALTTSSFGTAPFSYTPPPLEHHAFETLFTKMNLNSLRIPTSGVVVAASSAIPEWNDPAGHLAIAPLEIGVKDTHIAIMTYEHPGDQTPIADGIWIASTLAALKARANTAFKTTSGSIHWLTEREQVILDLLITGESVRTIADKLGRSPHTVHDHVKSLHRKLDASSRGALIARALGHNSSAQSTPMRAPDNLVEHGSVVKEIKPVSPQVPSH